MGTLASGSIDLKSLRVAGEPNKYITYISPNDGIKVFDGTNSTNYIQINSSGMKVYQGAALTSYKVADFGSDIKLYNNNYLRVQLNTDGLTIYNREGTKSVANFGRLQDVSNYTATIGANDSYHISMTAFGGMYFSNGVKTLGYLSVDGLEWFTNETTPKSMAHIGYGQGSSVTGVSTEAPYFTFGTRIAIASATNYSTSSTYDVGEVCKYNGELYVCIQKITQGEAWNSTKWSFINRGNWSVVEGIDNEAGYLCHVEGSNNKAVGNYNHIEGTNNVIGPQAAAGAVGATHVEGLRNFANAGYAHAEGTENIVTKNAGHVEGRGCVVEGFGGHAQNEYTVVGSNFQTAMGKYNIKDSSNVYALIIGNGEGPEILRSNALTVDWDGNVDIASGAKYKINGTALSAADVSAVALSDKYTRSSAGGLDWSNQTDGNAKIIAKSALAFWNGSYDGSNSNLTRFKASNGTSYSFGTLASKNSLSAADVGAVPKSVCCFANSVVRTPSSGTITFTLSELGITNSQKPVGILMTYQDGGASPTILRYDYDASSSSSVVIKAYDVNGNAVSSAIRFFMMVFQGSWTSV